MDYGFEQGNSMLADADKSRCHQTAEALGIDPLKTPATIKTECTAKVHPRGLRF
jgi:hypothetical protein